MRGGWMVDNFLMLPLHCIIMKIEFSHSPNTYYGPGSIPETGNESDGQNKVPVVTLMSKLSVWLPKKNAAG